VHPYYIELSHIPITRNASVQFPLFSCWFIFRTDALAKSALPFVCVSCKCDLPHPSAIEQANQVFNGYELQKTSSDSPRTQKRCISIVLRSIIARTSGKHEIPAYAPSSEVVVWSVEFQTIWNFCSCYTPYSPWVAFPGKQSLCSWHGCHNLRRPAPLVVHCVCAISRAACASVVLALACPCLSSPPITVCSRNTRH